MPTRAHVATILGFFLLLTGCSAPPADGLDPGLWGDATAVQELAIGVADGADELMFTRVFDLAVADDGTIFVADRSPAKLRAYDTQGRYVRTVGRHGQGPGEYMAPPGLGVLPDGRLAAWDYLTARLSFFAGSGGFLGSFRPETNIGGPRSLRVGHNGHLYLRGSDRVSPTDERPLIMEYTDEGEEIGRRELPVADPETRFFYLSAEGPIAAFGVETTWAWSPLGYVVVGRNDVYDIELRKPGEAIHLRRDVERVAVAPEEHAEWEAFRQLSPDLPPVPRVKPFFREIHVGEDGRVWVFRYVAADKRHDVEPLIDDPDRPLLTWREPWTYDVFEPDGTFVGSVVVPELFWPFVFRGDQIWGTLIDDDGVERILRLRVVTTSE